MASHHCLILPRVRRVQVKQCTGQLPRRQLCCVPRPGLLQQDMRAANCRAVGTSRHRQAPLQRGNSRFASANEAADNASTSAGSRGCGSRGGRRLLQPAGDGRRHMKGAGGDPARRKHLGREKQQSRGDRESAATTGISGAHLAALLLGCRLGLGGGSLLHWGSLHE
jgi:hypothetical protein